MKRFSFNRPDELVEKLKNEIPSKRQKLSHAQVSISKLPTSTDLVSTLIRRIVYAEGDLINIQEETVSLLKTELKSVVNLLLKNCNLSDKKI